MATAARRIAEFTAGLALDDVPAEVRAAAKLHALDAVGCGLAASASGDGGEVRATLTEGDGPASVIGRPVGAAAGDAALANGALCHALDFDDTHAAAVAHVSTVVVPAALAAAEAAAAGGGAGASGAADEGADTTHGPGGADVLAAIVAGNEVTIRIGAATAGGFHRRGFHPTSVCGVFGAAVAAARLRGLDADRTTRALGIAGSFAGGIFEYLADGSPTKPLHAGWAAHGGLLAAALAEQGAAGPETVLEGRFGLYATHVEGDWDVEPQLAVLGREWETPAIGFKPYPACHYVHAPVDAAKEALEGATVRADEVASVHARIPEAAVALTLEPAADKRAPRTPYDAKFSLPFAVAAMMVRGEVDLSTFGEPHLSDRELLALADRVTYEVFDYDTWPGAFPGAIEIELRDGRRLTAELPYERGHARNPMSDEDVRAKYRANAELALDAGDVRRIEDGLLALEDAASLTDLLSPLRRAATSTLEPSR